MGKEQVYGPALAERDAHVGRLEASLRAYVEKHEATLQRAEAAEAEVERLRLDHDEAQLRVCQLQGFEEIAIRVGSVLDEAASIMGCAPKDVAKCVELFGDDAINSAKEMYAMRDDLAAARECIARNTQRLVDAGIGCKPNDEPYLLTAAVTLALEELAALRAKAEENDRPWKRLSLIQEAAQDAGLSDGAARCVAANLSDPEYPRKPSAEAVAWARSVIDRHVRAQRGAAESLFVDAPPDDDGGVPDPDLGDEHEDGGEDA